MNATVGQVRSVPAPAPPAAAGERRVTAGYIRLTKDESLKGLSASAQRENITAYVLRAGLGPVTMYEELKAVGGDVPFELREAGRRLIDDVVAGRVGAIVVRDVDRLTRKLALWDQLRQLCTDHGVELHTLSGPLALRSPSDKFAGRVRAAAAELEKDQVGDRVRRVKRAMAQDGRHVGGPPSYGYTSQARRRADLVAAGTDTDLASVTAQTEYPQRGHLYVDQAEAKVVRLVFDRYVHDRWGVRRISNELNQLGHRRRSGLLWCPEKVRRIVNDPVVAGWIPFDEQLFQTQRGRRAAKSRQELHRGRHEPIVDQETWRRAQAIKAANTCQHLGRGTAAYASRRYPLTGVLRCTCGAAMAARPGRTGGSYGYYVCSKRKYRGPAAVGGCEFPPLNTDKVHEAFWGGVGELIASGDLVDRVHEAARRLADARRREQERGEDSVASLRKVEADLELWYRRHDGARAEAEQEAAWRRIVELTQRAKQLRERDDTKRADAAAAKSAGPPMSRERVARYLKSLHALVGQTADAGRAFVRSLVEHHGLTVDAQDASHLSIRLRLAPPGADPADATDAAFAVEIRGDARMAGDRITEWMRGQEGKHVCSCGCGRALPIRRKHYWAGVPQFHDQCRHKGMARKRWELAKDLYTGQRVATLLGIGRTTLGRWLTTGKLPQPTRSISGMLLFDPAAIDPLVAARAASPPDPPGRSTGPRRHGRACGSPRRGRGASG
jgi:site-specific DNA recombinase